LRIPKASDALELTTLPRADLASVAMSWPGVPLLRDLRELGVGRSQLARMTAWTVLFALFEGVGLGLLLPVLEYAEAGAEGVARSTLLDRALRAVGLEGERVALPTLLLLAFLPLVVRSVLHYARDVEVAQTKLAIAARLRARGAAAFLHASRAFLTAHGRGELVSALTVEADRAAEAMATRLSFATALVLAVVYLGLLTLLSPLLMLCTIPAALIVIASFRGQRSGASPLGVEVSEQNAELGLRLTDALAGVERVKLRGAEAAVAGRIGDTVERIRAGLLRIEKLRILVDIGMYPVAVAAAFAVVYVAIGPLGMSLASLGLFLFVLVRLVPQVTHLNSMWSAMHGCMASFVRLNDLLDAAERSRESAGGTRRFDRLESEIRFESVWFRYPGAPEDRWALRDVSCSVARGSITAIVGRSGAGKSTLVRLLAGFYAPDAGRILLDGVPLDELERAGFRRKLAIVPEDPFLFHGTVRENLAFGLDADRVASPPDLEEALALSHAAGFVSALERGLDTPVGERGARLSQGQRQRLAIAHALALDPEILILDEPTSALDPEAERAIAATLASRRGSLTIIVIAHRLATVRGADAVLVLDDGRLSASGAYRAVVASSTLYRELFEPRAEAG
jgi:ABC-type multidrug transport system fused ATPase/permease subunit